MSNVDEKNTLHFLTCFMCKLNLFYGNIIYDEGDLAENIYLIKEGEIEVS